MDGRLVDNTHLKNTEVSKLIVRKLHDVRVWFRKIRDERKDMDMQRRRRNRMLCQLQNESIERLTLELKSSLRVPRQ
jgi:hypothetical protein